jgi:hypothetical protein
MTAIIAMRTYVFQGDLMNSPVIVTTVKRETQWITIIENLPVHTFRGDSYKQDVVAVNKSWRAAKKEHNDIVKGKK